MYNKLSLCGNISGNVRLEEDQRSLLLLYRKNWNMENLRKNLYYVMYYIKSADFINRSGETFPSLLENPTRKNPRRPEAPGNMI